MKTIILDIETAPSLAYVWGAWKQNVGQDMLLKHTHIMSCAVKTLGEDETRYYENRGEHDGAITKQIVAELDAADFVIAHNARKFDIPMINASAIRNNIDPPSTYKVIDTLAIAKKEFRFIKNSLENLAIELQVPLRKLDHGKYAGFKLWLACINQDNAAWEEMKKYNIMDVDVLEQVYLRLRPWSSTHPNVTTADFGDSHKCPRCGSTHVHKRGFYYTNKGKYQRFKCTGCGGWSATTNTQNTKEKRQSLLVSR